MFKKKTVAQINMKFFGLIEEYEEAEQAADELVLTLEEQIETLQQMRSEAVNESVTANKFKRKVKEFLEI